MTTPTSPIGPREAVAFLGHRLISSGPLPDVAAILRTTTLAPNDPGPLVFDAQTSAPIELDLRGSEADVRARAASPRDAAPADIADESAPLSRGPGRPRLGVTAKEVTLLPRHWRWLAAQRGGASATIRRLIDAERQRTPQFDSRRRAREVAYAFISHIGGNLPGFESATRALFASDEAAFAEAIAGWPVDVATHLRRLAAPAFATADSR